MNKKRIKKLEEKVEKLYNTLYYGYHKDISEEENLKRIYPLRKHLKDW